MANLVQLKRSSVPGRVPDSSNVAVGEPVVNLADKVLYTKDGSGTIIVIGSGTTTNVAEGTNLYFTNTRAIGALTAGENITIAANGRITATATGGGGGTTYANVVVGELQAKEFTANGNQTAFDIDFVPGDANSIIVFVDSVLQAPDTNYTVANDILTFTATPEANAIVSVRYFDSGNVYETKYFIGVQSNKTFTANGSSNVFLLTDPLLNSEEALVFVNGVIQEPNVNYTVNGDVLLFNSTPSANAKIFVRTFNSNGNELDLGNLAVNVNAIPSVGQALVWNGSAYEPGNVSTAANVISVNGFTGVVSLNIEDLGNVSSNAAVAGQALVWDANIGEWAPGNVATEATATTLSLYSRFEFTAANNQTVFTGADDNSKVLNVNSGYAEVFLNGIRLVPNVDYTANATQVTLTEGADPSDALSVINFVDSTADFAADTFTGDGSTNYFNLSRAPSNEASILVSFDGIKQFASEYTVNQANLIFDTAPDFGANIEVVFLGAAQASTANNGWVEASSSLTATVGTKYMANTIGGSFTITLPASPIIGDSVIVLDATSSFDTSNVLISRNGKKIMGLNDDLYLDVADSYTELVYYNTTYGWRVIS